MNINELAIAFTVLAVVNSGVFMIWWARKQQPVQQRKSDTLAHQNGGNASEIIHPQNEKPDHQNTMSAPLMKKAIADMNEKWAYKTLLVSRDKYKKFSFWSGSSIEHKKFEKEINQLGDAGWEMIGMAFNDGINGGVLVFKRRK